MSDTVHTGSKQVPYTSYISDVVLLYKCTVNKDKFF